MAKKNPGDGATAVRKGAAPKKAAAKKAAPKKAAQPKPADAADNATTPAAPVQDNAALQVGQKVRWYHNGSEALPQNNYEATISELPNSYGIASLVVSIEGLVEHRSACQQIPGTDVAANAPFFIAE